MQPECRCLFVVSGSPALGGPGSGRAGLRGERGPEAGAYEPGRHGGGEGLLQGVGQVGRDDAAHAELGPDGAGVGARARGHDGRGAQAEHGGDDVGGAEGGDGDAGAVQFGAEGLGELIHVSFGAAVNGKVASWEDREEAGNVPDGRAGGVSRCPLAQCGQK